MKEILVGLVAGLFMVGLAGTACATPITIDNASFESPDISAVPHYTSPIAGIWVTYLDDWTGTYAAGTLRPMNAEFNEDVPDGAQIAYTNGPAISQTLTEELAANTLYTLSVYVGTRVDTTFAGYSIDLLAGGVSLANINSNSSLAPARGDWELVTLSYLSPSVVSPGQVLGIRLDDLVDAGLYGGTQVNFDMISLDATAQGSGTPVPEPATMLLFGTGLAGLVSLRRRNSTK